ncbi:PucR family transcriptional regulator [Ruminococcus gauvreauii]|uniref:Helix-turn-helix domain-containing protein n=1 Tax=Ruminococcus gauvreauii TaxID=438033 RepID=A0ABY5VLZ9_9FIRM|nr:PucR family transcriptional regulator [Ruminococcus gauvreauii]UWP61196.1 helix-turn-helix domain-containing protein [Ruminococcus gauvreauii]
MHLSMNIVRHELAKQFSLAGPQTVFERHANLRSAAMLTSAAPEPQILYVAEARRLPVRWKFQTHASLIISGQIPEDYFHNTEVDYICVDDHRFPVVLNAVLHIFQIYDIFDENLKSSIIRDIAPHLLCNMICSFLKLPLAVFDSFLRVHYISENAQNLIDWELDPVTGMRLLPTDFINQLNLVYTETAEDFIEGAVLLRDDRLPYNLICTMDGRKDYILVVFEMDTPLDRSMVEVVGYLNRYVLMSFENSTLKSFVPDSLSAVIQSMLEGTRLSRIELQNQLDAVGWDMEDTCCCIAMHSLTEQRNPKYISTFCLKLESLFSACVVFPYNKRVVAIVNLDRSKCPYFDIQRRISLLLRDGLMKAGVSFKYWNFETTPIYFQQACCAYDMGKLYNPTIWCYNFSEYALQYFMHYGSSRLPPRHLCHPGLVELHRYDVKNGTELLSTLETYVKNNCNAVTAANLLYIHRNTFYQRLCRIQELLHLNLDDPDERLYLMISTKLISMYYYELENGFFFPSE